MTPLAPPASDFRGRRSPGPTRGVRSAGSIATLLVLASLGVACDRPASTGESGASREKPGTVDTTVRLGGDRLTLRHDPRPHLVGDPIELLVVAAPADGAVATIELPGDGRLGAFDYVERPAPRLPDLPLGSAVRRLELSTFESGDLEVPPIEAFFERSGDGEVRTLATAPHSIAVASVLDEDATPGPDEDPVAALRPPRSAVQLDLADDHAAWWWAASVGVTAAVLVGAFLLLSRRGGPIEPPPAIWARDRIAELRACDPSVPPSERWAALADLLRGLLERRDGVPARDRTTAELARDLADDGRFGSEERNLIVAVLRRADLAKFAGAVDADVEGALDELERLVDAGGRRDDGDDGDGRIPS